MVCDLVAIVVMIWMVRDHAEIGEAVATANAIRMAGHLFAAVWVLLASVGVGGAVMPVGVALAPGFHSRNGAGAARPALTTSGRW